jgi:cytochrome c oxidase subunit 3
VKENLGGGNEPMGSSKLMMFFIVSDALTFSGFLAAYGFHDLNLLKHGHWLMRCYTLSIHAWRIGSMYYVALMTFILIFHQQWFWLLMLIK